MSINMSSQNVILGIMLRSQMVNTAQSQMGVREDPLGSNSGARIEEYQEYRPDLKGEPWCASFVSWAADDASKKLGVKRPFPHFEWVADIKNFAQSKGWLMDARKVQPKSGDIFIVNGNSPRENQHVGIVKGNVGNDKIETIEGNCSDMVKSRILPKEGAFDKNSSEITHYIKITA